MFEDKKQEALPGVYDKKRKELWIMAKKRLLLLVILSLLFTMASCGLDYRYQLDESKHNVFEVYWEDEDTNSTYFVYQGEKYVHTEESDVLNVYTDEYPFSDDILISWNGYRYIWYIDEYYSYDTEKISFILFLNP